MFELAFGHLLKMVLLLELSAYRFLTYSSEAMKHRYEHKHRTLTR